MKLLSCCVSLCRTKHLLFGRTLQNVQERFIEPITGCETSKTQTLSVNRPFGVVDKEKKPPASPVPGAGGGGASRSRVSSTTSDASSTHDNASLDIPNGAAIGERRRVNVSCVVGLCYMS